MYLLHIFEILNCFPIITSNNVLYIIIGNDIIT